MVRLFASLGCVLILGFVAYNYLRPSAFSSSEGSAITLFPKSELQSVTGLVSEQAAEDETNSDDRMLEKFKTGSDQADDRRWRQDDRAMRDRESAHYDGHSRVARARGTDSSERAENAEDPRRGIAQSEAPRRFEELGLPEEPAPSDELALDDADRNESGQLVFKRVEAGTPAWEAGIRPGDTLLTFDGQVITDSRSLGRLYSTDPSPVQLTWRTAAGRIESSMVPGSGLAGVGFQRQ